jgi:phage FluMu gp28-like protein
VTEASTKSGKTIGGIVWLVEQAMQGKKGRNYWWVAPIYPQAKIAFRRLKQALPLEVYTSNESENTVTLANGAVIWFKSAENPDSLYGEDVWACVIDEASRVKEDSWHAVRSTLTATQGQVRIIGNVKGRKNWAYTMARKAESGEPNMSYHKITAYDAIQAGVIKPDEVEDAKRQLPESVFKELYLAEPSDDEGNPFGIKAIRECIKIVSAHPSLVYGIDLAKSVDFTVIIGLDNNRQIARFERFQSPWQETMNRIRNVIVGQRAIVDSTGVGDPIVEQLKRSGLHIEGYKFTQTSKQQLMEGLAYAIQQHLISYPEGIITQELEAFEYEYTRIGVRYSAPEGLHDDCVCALALANNGFRKAPAEIRWM